MSERARPHERWEVVIGLEVHVHMRTASKLFSPAPVRYGDPPNHDTHPLDLGLPGVLPVLNRRAVELGVRAALATHCKVHPRSIFARKNYFYPDLPKGYQISQYEEPLATGGFLEIDRGALRSSGRAENRADSNEVIRVGLTRIHIEEDAGKSIHDTAVASSDDSHIDLNRAGVPLLEIVSEPDLRSPEEAAAYLRALRAVLRWTDVSDADMEKGQFRCDANVSLRSHGSTQLGTRTELKNLNSFRFVEEAIQAEIARQSELLDAGGKVVQATMHYDATRRATRVMRLKENADDYRYFPDPDLVPLLISEAEIDAVRAALPELPEQRRARFEREWALSAYDARLLTETRALADFYEAACAARGGASGSQAAGGGAQRGEAERSSSGSRADSAKSIANWMLRDVLAQLKERDCEIDATQLTPDALAQLIELVESGRVTAASARPLVAELIESGGDPAALVRERGLEAVSDPGVLESAADQVIAAHPDVVAQIRGGDEKGLNFLMGQLMKRTQGKANPKAVREILARKLEG